MSYIGKKIDYGYKEKVLLYANEIETGKKQREKKIRKKYDEMSEEERKRSDERRIRYYKKISNDLIELACMNDFKSMVTLTFRDNVVEYEKALEEWKKFLKRLRHKVDELKYICVWEYQEKRGKVFHFHTLFNFCMDKKELEKIWGNGYVWISALRNETEKLVETKYILKYVIKGISKLQGENNKRVRLFFTSNNLDKPTIKKIDERVNLEDIIFEHMDEMISDGSYYIKNHNGEIMNRCDYVEYKTKIRNDNKKEKSYEKNFYM